MSIKHATQTTSLERKLATETTSLKRKIENSQSTCEAKTRTLHTLANVIATRTTVLENKQR